MFGACMACFIQSSKIFLLCQIFTYSMMLNIIIKFKTCILDINCMFCTLPMSLVFEFEFSFFFVCVFGIELTRFKMFVRRIIVLLLGGILVRSGGPIG